MSWGILLLMVLVATLISTIPLVTVSPGWRYRASGQLGPMVLVVVLLLLTGLV